MGQAARRRSSLCLWIESPWSSPTWTAVNRLLGKVAEWFKAAVLKTAVGASLPWVRIPPFPPTAISAFQCHTPSISNEHRNLSGQGWSCSLRSHRRGGKTWALPERPAEEATGRVPRCSPPATASMGCRLDDNHERSCDIFSQRSDMFALVRFREREQATPELA